MPDQPDTKALARQIAREMKRKEQKPGSLLRPVTFLLVDLPRLIFSFIGFVVVAMVVWLVITTPS